MHLFHKLQDSFDGASRNELPASIAVGLDESGGTGTLFPHRLRLEKCHMLD
jgi:hypothetical protein